MEVAAATEELSVEEVSEVAAKQEESAEIEAVAEVETSPETEAAPEEEAAATEEAAEEVTAIFVFFSNSTGLGHTIQHWGIFITNLLGEKWQTEAIGKETTSHKIKMHLLRYIFLS